MTQLYALNEIHQALGSSVAERVEPSAVDGMVDGSTALGLLDPADAESFQQWIMNRGDVSSPVASVYFGDSTASTSSQKAAPTERLNIRGQFQEQSWGPRVYVDRFSNAPIDFVSNRFATTHTVGVSADWHTLEDGSPELGSLEVKFTEAQPDLRETETLIGVGGAYTFYEKVGTTKRRQSLNLRDVRSVQRSGSKLEVTFFPGQRLEGLTVDTANGRISIRRGGRGTWRRLKERVSSESTQGVIERG